MERPPRNSDEPILTPFLLWRIGFVSLILVAGTFGLFAWERASGAGLDAARTVAVNTLVMFEVFYLLNARYIHRSVLPREGLASNRFVLLAIGAVLIFHLLFTYAAPFQFLFQTEPMTAGSWLRMVLMVAAAFVLVEAEKFLLRRKKWKA
jgi:magnesium-transporting ATPase (P-type)